MSRAGRTRKEAYEERLQTKFDCSLHLKAGWAVLRLLGTSLYIAVLGRPDVPTIQDRFKDKKPFPSQTSNLLSLILHALLLPFSHIFRCIDVVSAAFDVLPELAHSNLDPSTKLLQIDLVA